MLETRKFNRIPRENIHVPKSLRRHSHIGFKGRFNSRTNFSNEKFNLETRCIEQPCRAV